MTSHTTETEKLREEWFEHCLENTAGTDDAADWWLDKLDKALSSSATKIREEVEFQIAVMTEIADRMDDIAEDLMQLPDYKTNGLLLGLGGTAKTQIIRLDNLKMRLKSLLPSEGESNQELK